MDLTKTAREITRLMLPYLTTQQNRQLKKVLSHCLFDENQLAENSGDSDNKSFLDLFLSAKRLEGCSDRTVAYYEATINKLLELQQEFADFVAQVDKSKFKLGTCGGML